MDDVVNDLSAKLPAKIRGRFLAAAKNLVGNPTKYHEDLLPKILFYYSQGYTISQVASECGVARSTYYEWLDKFPKLRDIHTIGRNLARTWCEELCRENLINPDRNFNDRLFECRMKREYHLDEQNSVDLGAAYLEAKTHDEKLAAIDEAVGKAKISPNQALQLQMLIKNKIDINMIPDLLDQIDSLKSRLKGDA